MTSPTIKTPQLFLNVLPISSLVPLDVDRRDERIADMGFDVVFKDTVIGSIPAPIAWRDRTLRWHDVLPNSQIKKRKREYELPSHEKSMILLQKCFENGSKPQYFQDPFPYGTESIQDLAMIGGEQFERTMLLYNHWFNVAPLERLLRETRHFDPSKLSTEDLNVAEKQLKTQWIEAHGALMKRGGR